MRAQQKIIQRKVTSQGTRVDIDDPCLAMLDNHVGPGDRKQVRWRTAGSRP